MAVLRGLDYGKIKEKDGHDLDDNKTNQLYAFNGIPNFYRDR